MSERNIGQEILEGIQEVKKYKAGQVTLKTSQVDNLPSPQAIRKRLQLSQSEFALLMGVSIRTLQDWEQGRRQPRGPAQSLLRIADHHPEVFLEIA